jgi:hypothetical protein
MQSTNLPLLDSLCPKCRRSFANSRAILAHLNNKFSPCSGHLDDYDAISSFTEEATQRRAEHGLNAFWDRIPPPPSPPPPLPPHLFQKHQRPLHLLSITPARPSAMVKEQIHSRGSRITISHADGRLTPIIPLKDAKSGSLLAFLQAHLFPRSRSMNSSGWNGYVLFRCLCLVKSGLEILSRSNACLRRSPLLTRFGR